MRGKLSRLFMQPILRLAATLLGRTYYTTLQKFEYRVGTSDHLEHNENPDLRPLLLAPAFELGQAGRSKAIVDFGSGQGRNVSNLLEMGYEGPLIGLDISRTNVDSCKRRFGREQATFFVTDGTSLQPLATGSVSVVFSTIVLQHIPVWSIRDSLFRDTFRVLEANGSFLFQMGFGPQLTTPDGRKLASYDEDARGALGSNGTFDVQVQTENQVIDHLQAVGFTDIKVHIRPSFSDNQHDSWIFVSARVPESRPEPTLSSR